MTIKYEFAKTSSGKIVHVTEAKNGEKYTCANEHCNSEMILKNGEIRQPHFAHKNDYNHADETPLHYNTKFIIFKYLNDALKNKKPANLTFLCVCSETHSINLLDGVTEVCLEKQVTDTYRPDISLFCDGKLKMSIEIVVTHDLEPEALSYLTKHKIPFLKINATDELYGRLLEKDRTKDLDFLTLSDVEIKGINIPDYCDNNVEVTYYPEFKNIFPCFGYEKNEDSDNQDNKEKFEQYFRSRISDGILPCNTCKNFLSMKDATHIRCKYTYSKLMIYQEDNPNIIDKHEFTIDYYYKSGKNYRDNRTMNCIKNNLYKYIKSLDFFEYEMVIPDCNQNRPPKVYKNGEWVEPSENDIIKSEIDIIKYEMKETYFEGGKYIGQTLDDVYNINKSYLQWVFRDKRDDYGSYALKLIERMYKFGLI